ncbi:MAG: hypothetical protein KF847_19630, partial [Pirellulales bacterium]|nr:hypothetical protein [Pirellulales bacterium]
MTIDQAGRPVRARLSVRDWIAIASLLAGIAYSYLRMQWTTERLQAEVALGNHRQEVATRELTDEIRQMRRSHDELSHRVTRLEAVRESGR